MTSIKNIAILLLTALFICVSSNSAWAQAVPDLSSAAPVDNTRVATKANIEALKAKMAEANNVALDKIATEDAALNVANNGQGGANSGNFCSANLGIFTGLVSTGQLIFNRLRDLIYVVAGFGIIAVAVGGFFGNLNWKWLGAIVISLVVIATTGELIVLITGCKAFGSRLITNTLRVPGRELTTAEYLENYTEDASDSYEAHIDYNPKFAGSDMYAPGSQMNMNQQGKNNSTGNGDEKIEVGTNDAWEGASSDIIAKAAAEAILQREGYTPKK